MSVALRGISLPHRVAVHDVAGLAPGVYRWPDLAAPARPGELRAELRRVCLGQGLPHDAAFVVIAAARLAGLDDREYRAAQLSAGLAEGRLHLAAYALGAGASGMTFLDSEVPSLLGEPLDALLFTCVACRSTHPGRRPARRPGQRAQGLPAVLGRTCPHLYGLDGDNKAGPVRPGSGLEGLATADLEPSALLAPGDLHGRRGPAREAHADTLTASLNGSGHHHGWDRDLA